MALARPSRLTVDEDLPEKLREHIDEPDPRRAARPTKALPGTPEYLAVMESRAAAGQPLRVPGDAELDDPRQGLRVEMDNQGNRRVVGQTGLTELGVISPSERFSWNLTRLRIRAGFNKSELARLVGCDGREIGRASCRERVY